MVIQTFSRIWGSAAVLPLNGGLQSRPMRSVRFTFSKTTSLAHALDDQEHKLFVHLDWEEAVIWIHSSL